MFHMHLYLGSRSSNHNVLKEKTHKYEKTAIRSYCFFSARRKRNYTYTFDGIIFLINKTHFKPLEDVAESSVPLYHEKQILNHSTIAIKHHYVIWNRLEKIHLIGLGNKISSLYKTNETHIPITSQHEFPITLSTPATEATTYGTINLTSN